MIIGSGDIASVLNDREGALFFASGVSNSNCTVEKEYFREIEMLLDLSYLHRKDHTLFYFSSISISEKVTRYYCHKQVMEMIVRLGFERYNIIRIGNIDWGKNPHTFVNAIKAKQAKGEPVEIRDEWKYMISKEQLLLLTDNLPLKGQNTISVFGEMKKVKDCL
jgi:hypothetical protein